MVVGVPAVAVAPAVEEVAAAARAEGPASAVETAAALLPEEAKEAVPRPGAEMAWAVRLQREEEVSSWTAGRYRYHHPLHRHRNPTVQERKQV